jgi:hypothetical protein
MEEAAEILSAAFPGLTNACFIYYSIENRGVTTGIITNWV